MTKPRIFIGSSTEGRSIAEGLMLNFEDDFEVVIWTTAFDLSKTYIESLEDKLANVEFAVLIATPDDVRDMRSDIKMTPRDNVILECGLFMGRLGRERTFIVRNAKLTSLPTDLLGVESADYDASWAERNAREAMAKPAASIKHSIRLLPRIGTLQQVNHSYEALFDADALYQAVVSWQVTPKQNIIVQMSDTTWVWKLVPTLLYWRLKGVHVRVYAQGIKAIRKSAVSQEQARRRLLTELGIVFHEIENFSTTGFFLKSQYPDDSIAIVVNEQKSRGMPLAIQYSGISHSGVIELLHSALPDILDGQEPDKQFVPSLIEQDIEEIYKLLRSGVRQYFNTSIEIVEQNISIANMKVMTSYARSYKMTQVERLYDLYGTLKLTPFKAMAIKLRSGAKSIITPPVVEISSEGNVVIEGTTRAAFCAAKGIKQYYCIAVRGVKDPLPGNAVHIDQLSVSKRTLNLSERTDDYIGISYRNIERAVHPY